MIGRGWKVALVGSLVLNAFLVGGIAGGAYQWIAAHPTHESTAARVAPGAAPGRAGLRFAAEGLSAERQRQFAATLRQARQQGRDDAVASRDARRDVIELLGAPQIDERALDAALARARTADSALRERVERGVVEFAATLSPQERVTFVAGLRERGQFRTAAPAQQPRSPQP